MLKTASSVVFAAEDIVTNPSPSPAAGERERGKKSDLRKEMRMLAKSGDEASFSDLASYAADTDPRIRREAARALARSKKQEAFDLLLVLIHDESSGVRGSAAWSMGYQRNEKADDILIEVLEKDKSSTVREKAVRALGRLRTEKARDKVLDCLKSEQVEIRSSAARALGSSRDKKVIEPLISALRDRDYRVRSAASKSLSRLSGQDEIHEKMEGKSADEMHKAWRDWWKKNKETFEIVGRGRRSASAKEWVKKYDADKDGKLNEKELQAALDEKRKGRRGGGIEKGATLKTDVTVKRPDGSETKLRGLIKGTTLVYYFRSKCRHCVKAEGFIRKLYADNKGKGIAFLGIAGGRGSIESLNAYIDKAKFEFPVVRDSGREFAKRNRPGGTPLVLIVDASGKVLESYRGLSDDKKEQLAKGLAELSKK
jgi:peroxiredoxin